MARKGGDKDPVLVFAEKLRDHKKLESRWAIMQESRVEYFRGKDFASLLTDQPDLPKSLGFSDAVQDAGNLLLRRKLIIRCDRVVKTLRPGKKKLSKWPARLELHKEQKFSENDAFFAWTFEKRRPLWQTILSFMLPVVTVGVCLLPLYPYWVKLLITYTCLTLLAVIFGVLLVRVLIFGFMWVFLGKRVWFFPNLLADEASFSELIKFWPKPPKADDQPPKWTARLAVACLTCIVTWLCVRHAPDEAARSRYHKKMSNIIDEVLEWSPKLAITGQWQSANETDATGSNATAAEAATAATSEAASSEDAAA